MKRSKIVKTIRRTDRCFAAIMDDGALRLGVLGGMIRQWPEGHHNFDSLLMGAQALAGSSAFAFDRFVAEMVCDFDSIAESEEASQANTNTIRAKIGDADALAEYVGHRLAQLRILAEHVSHRLAQVRVAGGPDAARPLDHDSWAAKVKEIHGDGVEFKKDAKSGVVHAWSGSDHVGSYRFAQGGEGSSAHVAEKTKEETK